MADKRPIIIIKKVSGHAGHHGGAWKVAYADFVTAMMALFIVLWLTSSGEKVRKSIAGYFNDPSGKASTPGTDRNGGESVPLDKNNIKGLKARLDSQIAQRPDLKPLANQIDIVITPEGMRIELIESKDGTFFESGSAVLKPAGKELLQILAKELGSVPNRVSMEGHTDAQPYSDKTRYDNWDLSTDRANAARRAMQTSGLHLGQVSQVRGFADQRLRVPSNPLDPSNRRISVIVHYLETVPTGFTDPNAVPPKAGVNLKAAADSKPDKAGNPATVSVPKNGSENGSQQVTPASTPASTKKPSALQTIMGEPKAIVGKVTDLLHKKPPPAAATKSKSP